MQKEQGNEEEEKSRRGGGGSGKARWENRLGNGRHHPGKYARGVESLASLLTPSLVEKAGDPESLCSAPPPPSACRALGC